MARRASSLLFRNTFTFANKDVAKWFPGHMKKGKDQVLNLLKELDCIIEVHDARIPFSGRNPWFRNVMSIRPRVFVMNKIDLADLSRKDEIERAIKSEGANDIVYTNCKEQHNAVSTRLIPRVMELVRKSNRYHRAEEDSVNLMIIGVPNVGKSSLINSLRGSLIQKRKAAKVGAKAGVTRSVMEKIKVSLDPPIYLYDTPGILSPDVKNVEVGLKLALCANLQDHLVGPDIIVDYMLYWLNKHERFEYVEHYGLDGPTDDVLFFMSTVAQKNERFVKFRTGNVYEYKPDLTFAAMKILKTFRSGSLGKVMLDDDVIDVGSYDL